MNIKGSSGDVFKMIIVGLTIFFIIIIFLLIMRKLNNLS